MTSVKERVSIEAPYVQAIAPFERRLGLSRGVDHGHCLLGLTAPLSDGRDIAREVSASTQRVTGTGNFISRYGIAWDAGQTPHGVPTPGFQGTLTLRAGDDYGRCELELDGEYEAPGGVAGKLFDDVFGRRIAHATLSSLLDGVRDELRSAHVRIEAAKRVG